MTVVKPKLSGAARRKLARQKAQAHVEGAPSRPLSAELLAPVKVEDLDTVAGYRRELNRVYGMMRAGQMRGEDGTKLAYVLCQGAGLARIEQELREAAAIREALVRLQGDRQLLSHSHGTAPAAEDSTVIAEQIGGAADGEVQS